MSKVLVIGAGGVGSVAVHKMAMCKEVFSHITLASRRYTNAKPWQLPSNKEQA